MEVQINKDLMANVLTLNMMLGDVWEHMHKEGKDNDDMSETALTLCASIILLCKKQYGKLTKKDMPAYKETLAILEEYKKKLQEAKSEEQ